MASRYSLRFSFAFLTTIALAACGGGGGGGTITTTPGTPSAAATPTPTASPTVAPTTQATSAPVSTSSSTNVQIGGVSNGGTNEVLGANVTLPAANVATTASLTMSGPAPSGVTAPSLHSMSMRISSLGIQSTIAYIGVRFANDVTLSQSIGLTANLPGVPNGNWYLLFLDPSGVLGTGWSEVAQLAISGSNLTLTPTALNPSITLKASQWYYFAIASTGSNPITTPSPTPTANPTASPTATPTASPTASPTPEATINPAAIPMGMISSTAGKWSATTPQAGYVYSCQSSFTGGSSNAPWIDNTNLTWNSTTKAHVEGSVSWTSTYAVGAQSGSSFTISTNDEPLNETTGIYPVKASDPAYQYDKNPNSILAQVYSWTLPWNPTVASQPSCVPMGAIGITTDGVVMFNALDADGRDAAAYEVLDSCGGHPQSNGVYHYHALSTACLNDTHDADGHSGLVGYAFDGFGVYGPDGVGGNQLQDSDLDACHGHTHMVLFHGVEQVIYHYHMTTEFPYTVGCYKGTPIAGY